LKDVLQDLQQCASSYFYKKWEPNLQSRSSYAVPSLTHPTAAAQPSVSNTLSSPFYASANLQHGFNIDKKKSWKGETKRKRFPKFLSQQCYTPFEELSIKPSKTISAKLVTSQNLGLPWNSGGSPLDSAESNKTTASSKKRINCFHASTGDSIKRCSHTHDLLYNPISHLSDDMKERRSQSGELSDNILVVELTTPQLTDVESPCGIPLTMQTKHSSEEKCFGFPKISPPKIQSTTTDINAHNTSHVKM